MCSLWVGTSCTCKLFNAVYRVIYLVCDPAVKKNIPNLKFEQRPSGRNGVKKTSENILSIQLLIVRATPLCIRGHPTKPCRKPSQEIRKTLFVTSNFMKSRMSIARMSIAIVATHICIRGSRIPMSRMSQHPQWEDGAGHRLFYYH